MKRFWSTLAALAALALLLATPAATRAQSGQRCFSETGYCISGRIREYWEQNGGLPVFGLPITPQQPETISGTTLQVQWFERNRLELHPENKRPYDVLLGRLGAEYVDAQPADEERGPASEPNPSCRFFTETGLNVCDDILRAWRANGIELDGRAGKTEAENLALWGLPLTHRIDMTLGDGKTYTVQWFERARFELHPENRPPYNVLLGLVGKERGPTASAPPSAPAAPTGCAAVQQLNAKAGEGKKMADAFVASLAADAEEGTRPAAVDPKFSVIDALDGWGIFSFTAAGYDPIIVLIRPASGGRYERAVVWGGISEDGLPGIRAYFKAQVPDVPATLIDCWEPRALPE